jgi:thioredoxin-like negative regulator of GroEL
MKKIIYFTSTWCQPCRTLGPIMEQVREKIPVEKIDVDNAPAVAAAYNVRNIPTVILVENGEEIRRFTGVKPLNDILNFI